MLDDLKLINDRDPSDALGLAQRSWKQLEVEFDVAQTDFRPHNIVYGGMGGSALAAFLATSWPKFKIPFEISRNYDLPGYIDENSLVILSSYSGNTEETLSALKDAQKKNAKIYIISNGGELSQVAKDKNYPLLFIPDSTQPRYSVFYQLIAIVKILIATGQLNGEAINDQIQKAKEFLKEASNDLIATVPKEINIAKQIATQTAGKSVVIYTGPVMAPAAYKWKISFNENAKQIAWWNTFPEFSHNEFIGWTEQPPIKPYCVIDIRSNLENQRILKRFELTAKLLSGRRPSPIVVQPKGDSLLEQILYTVMLGDFCSIYAAILNGVNPIPVDLIEKFKKELES